MTEPNQPTAAPVVDPTPQVADAVSAHLGGENALTPEQVAQVLAAYNAVQAGEPLGTIARDPATGAVAHRVIADGVHMWRISKPDGTVWNDLSGTLPGWDILVTGGGA